MSQRIMTPKVASSRYHTRAVVIATVIATAFAAALVTTPLSAMANQPAATTTAAATTQSAALRQTRDAMQSAKDNLDAKTRQTEEAKTRVTTATAKYNSAKAAQQQTTKATASQTTKEAQSALGFFKSHNAYVAYRILTDSSVSSYLTDRVNLGGEDDATNLNLLLKDLDYIDELNDIREKEGLPDLKIDDAVMAAALKRTDDNKYRISKGQEISHDGSGDYGFSENIDMHGGMGYRSVDPLADYLGEKKTFDAYVASGKYPGLEEHRHDAAWVLQNYPALYTGDATGSGMTGHYLNMVDATHDLAGIGIAFDSTNSAMTSAFEAAHTSGEYYFGPSTASTDDLLVYHPADHQSYTVEQYRHMLNDYITSITGAKSKLENANTALTNAKTALDTATSAYSKAMQEERNARQEYQQAKAAYDNCLKGNCPTPTPTPTPQPATIAMQRLYNPYTGEHFYTSSTQERDALKRAGWRYEGIGWTAPKTGDPVYRLYNPYAPGGDHHYTTSTRERDTLKQAGWRYEGVGWMSATIADKTRKPLHREYNPYATTGTHNYTLDTTEHRHLITLGWHDEGTAWYATA